MRPDPQDRTVDSGPPARGPMTSIIAALLIAGGLAWWLLNHDEPAPPDPPAEPAPAAVVEPEPPPAPDIPQQAPEPEPVVESVTTTEPEQPAAPAEPPPTLETSDDELRQRLALASDSPLVAQSLAIDNLVERGSASVDSLSRGGLPGKMLPMPAPEGKFPVTEIGGQLTLDPAGYKRYDAHAKMIENLDTETIVAGFHRFRPLLESAYAQMGYRPEEFDNAVIRALDRILAAPLVDGPIPLARSEAVYKFTDPRLENRSALEKQLLRMGPENTARVQRQAQALRSALLSGT